MSNFAGLVVQPHFLVNSARWSSVQNPQRRPFVLLGYQGISQLIVMIIKTT